jgi:ubiquinone/menaquinone biosynthesis C-methylase UbiE
MKKERRIRSHYEHRIDSARANYEVLDWASEESQQARFAVLVRSIELRGRSLLDVGCGLGDLLTFLQHKGIEVDYTGVDILEPMVEAATRQHPDAQFLQADIFAGDPFEGRRFDVVFCSGALNLNLGNNREFLPIAMARMLDLSRECVVVNLLHRRSGPTDRTYFSHDPDDVRTLLRDLPCELQILEDYLPNDFTVVCRHRKG